MEIQICLKWKRLIIRKAFWLPFRFWQIIISTFQIPILLTFVSTIFQVAASALESSLLKYSAKEYFFRAALCHLCVDSLNAQHALHRYEEQYPAFADSREAKLIKVHLCRISSVFVVNLILLFPVFVCFGSFCFVFAWFDTFYYFDCIF